MRIDLFVVDGQNDFCASGNEPSEWGYGGQKGALFVEKADAEAVLVANMIDRLADPSVPGGHKISKIRPTFDSHPKKDCSHHTSWKDKTGNVAPPFTIVTHEMVENQEYVPNFRCGVWHGKTISAYQWALNYTAELEKVGRAPLCLWPEHCKIGHWGQNIYRPLADAYDRWCDVTGGWLDPITKGDWPFTEHYSALLADVPEPTRLNTQMNADVVTSASKADRVLWVGWAGSHCLAWTAKDGVNFFNPTPEQEAQGAKNEFIKKCVFFEDASAEVAPSPPGCDFVADRRAFLDEMDSRGAEITTTTAFLA
jgi:nicotinamidase-related amidase